MSTSVVRPSTQVEPKNSVMAGRCHADGVTRRPSGRTATSAASSPTSEPARKATDSPTTPAPADSAPVIITSVTARWKIIARDAGPCSWAAAAAARTLPASTSSSTAARTRASTSRAGPEGRKGAATSQPAVNSGTPISTSQPAARVNSAGSSDGSRLPRSAIRASKPHSTAADSRSARLNA